MINPKKNNYPSFVLILLVHIAFGIFFSNFIWLSKFHSIITLLIGLILASSSKNQQKIPVVVAYIVGSEILWRMTGGNFFWEYGKYAVVLILLLAILRQKKAGMVLPALLFIGLMFFSIPLTFANLPFGDAREAISFNLSGPLTLAVSVMYFSKQVVSKLEIKNIILAFVAPVVSIATINIQGILLRSSIVFSNNSNFATSGGFGPNQVSAILGLAGLFLILLFVVVGVKWYRSIIYVGLALIFFVLSAITFSRGGLLNVVGSIIAIVTLTLFKPKIQATLLAVTVVFWVAWSFGVDAWMDRFTGGAFSKRFSNTDTTGRLELVMIQYELWKRNFFFGVGPGMANWEYLKTFGRSMASHTEYSRMLVEHGLFGLGSMLIMFWMPIQKYFSKRNQISKIWLAAMVVWSMIEMSHAATRIAAVGFVFGLGFITIDNE